VAGTLFTDSEVGSNSSWRQQQLPAALPAHQSPLGSPLVGKQRLLKDM
jgi:hypothetical protein